MTIRGAQKKSRSLISIKLKAWGSRALLQALLLPVVIMTGGCFDSSNVGELESERDSILHSIERYQAESGKIQDKIAKLEEEAEGAIAAQEGIDEALAERKLEEQEIEEFEEKLRLFISLLAACKESFHVKMTLEPGAKFESITLKDGKELKNVVLKSFTPQVVRLSHSAGVGSFPVNQMPDMITKHYILPPSGPSASIDFSAIFERKPNIMKTYQQIRKEKGAAYEARRVAADMEVQQRSDKRAADRRVIEKKRAVTVAAEKKKKGQIEILRVSLRKYQSAYYELQRAYESKLKSMEQSGIRQAPADRQKVLAIYNTKGAALRKEISKIEAQIAAISASK